MSFQLELEVSRLDVKPAARKLVLWVYAFHANDDGIAFPAIETVAAEASISETQVHVHVDSLRTEGLLEPRGRTMGGRGRSVRYRVLPTVTLLSAASSVPSTKGAVGRTPSTDVPDEKGPARRTVSDVKGAVQRDKGSGQPHPNYQGTELSGALTRAAEPPAAARPLHSPTPPPLSDRAGMVGIAGAVEAITDALASRLDNPTPRTYQPLTPAEFEARRQRALAQARTLEQNAAQQQPADRATPQTPGQEAGDAPKP